ncbi:hypothetical protein [Streptomyces sp. NPDC001056]
MTGIGTVPDRADQAVTRGKTAGRLRRAGRRAPVHGPRRERARQADPGCGHRHRPTTLVGGGSSGPVARPVREPGPREFGDVPARSERPARARAATGPDEAVPAGSAETGGRPVVVAVTDLGFPRAIGEATGPRPCRPPARWSADATNAFSPTGCDRR